MLKNYIIIAFRNLKRNKTYVLINMAGLAVGIACTLLVLLYIQHELSFDQYHENKDRIYSILGYNSFGETKQWGRYVSGDPTKEIRTNYPDVEDAVKIIPAGSDRIMLADEVYRDIKMFCTESNLFNIFSFKLIKGNPSSVLNDPNTAVITASLAGRLFKDESPIGKSIPVNFVGEMRNFEVTGLMEDVPANTHFTFDLLLSYESLKSTNRCLDCGQLFYVLLRENADPEAIAERVLKLIRETQGQSHVEDILLEPLSDIHFSEASADRQGDESYVIILTSIAIVILLIACANYMNLTTAYFSQRLREIGMRKVLGAFRMQLIRQFLLETLCLTILTLPLAFIFLILALPIFNVLARTDVVIDWGTNSLFYFFIAVMVLLVGLIAGSYPALFLSAFKPVEVLRGRLNTGFTATGIRKGLVVFQFTVSIVMIIFISVVLWQLRFMQHKKLGFDADQIITVRVVDLALASKGETLKQEFLQLASVEKASGGFALPGQNMFSAVSFIHRLNDDPESKIRFHTPSIDADFLETLNIELITGRNISFSPDISSSPARPKEEETLINKAGLRVMGWKSPEEAIDKKIGNYKIVGVVKDFHFQSLHQPINPLLLHQNNTGQIGVLALRIKSGMFLGALKDLERIWKDTGAEQPFEYSFLSEDINQLYGNEERTGQIIGLFAGLSILIACLGLLGLATFTAEQRTKEIGIRKVLGASVQNLVLLLFKDVAYLVVIAVVIASPIAFYASQKWLENFAFRIEVTPIPFVIVGILALLLAFLSMSIQSIRVALRNPVDSLRYE